MRDMKHVSMGHVWRTYGTCDGCTQEDSDLYLIVFWLIVQYKYIIKSSGHVGCS